MKTLDDLIARIEAMDSLSYEIEGALDGVVLDAGDLSKDGGRAQNLFFLLREQIRLLIGEADELNGHIKVCNAVYAVNQVGELRDEIDRLKEENDRLMEKKG